MPKTTIEYQIIDHGCDGEQYFPGCGVSFTQYDHVATGIGNSAREAALDAYEPVADFTAGVVDDIGALYREIMELSDVEDTDAGDPDTSPEWHHYVSIRYRVTVED